MSLFGRSAAVCGGVVLALTLSACSGGGDSQGGDTGSAKPAPPGNSGTAIKDPKDAAAADLCSLLPPNTANAIGVDPHGQAKSSEVTNDKTCGWKENTDNIGKGLTITLTSKDISGVYGQPQAYADFERLTIAGYPAARANQAQRGTVDTCHVFVATKPGQMLMAQGAVAPDKVGKDDPCQIAQQALEAAVPLLPSAK